MRWDVMTLQHGMCTLGTHSLGPKSALLGEREFWYAGALSHGSPHLQAKVEQARFTN